MAFLSSTLDTCQRACPAQQAQCDVEIICHQMFFPGFSASVNDNQLILVILVLLGVDCGACLEVGIHD